MLDEHDGDVEPVPEHADVVHELVGLGGVHARRRLVEEQELGLRRQGPDDLQPPLVPVGQVPRQAVRLVGQVEEVQQLQCPHVLPSLGAPPAGEPEHVREHPVAVAVAHAHLHVVLHGHAGEEPDVLEGPGDAQAIELVHGLAPGVLAVQQDPALGGLIHVGQQVEDRGLARAVGADEPRDLRAADEEREVVHGPKAPEVHAQVPDVQDGGLARVPLRDDAQAVQGDHVAVHRLLRHGPHLPFGISGRAGR